MMLINKNIKLVGKKVILVPYREEHVPRYHLWMQSEELQDLTGSMPLTLEQEYNMQKSWQTDEDKLTFIILDKHLYETTNDEIASMIGDTNIFVLPSENEETSRKIINAEPEIMIAEKDARHKGCGLEAMMLMLKYGIDILKIQQYTAKIGEDNKPSISMFKKLGFVQKSTSKIFKEVTLKLKVNDKVVLTLAEKLKGMEIKEHE